MEKLDTYIEFVKEQLSFQLKMADKFIGQPYRVSLHENSAVKYRDLLTYLESLRPKTPEASPEQSASNRFLPQRRQVMLSLDDLKDLPDSVLDELNLTDSDRQDLLIESIINEAGGVLSLDKILIELYRRSGVVVKRQVLVSRLYRMAQRRAIFNPPNKKGVYSTFELTPQEVRRIFGHLDGEAEPINESGALTVVAS